MALETPMGYWACIRGVGSRHALRCASTISQLLNDNVRRLMFNGGNKPLRACISSPSDFWSLDSHHLHDSLVSSP